MSTVHEQVAKADCECPLYFKYQSMRYNSNLCVDIQKTMCYITNVTRNRIPGNFPGIYTIEKCSVLTVKAMAHVCFMRKEAKHCMLHIVYTVRNGW